MISFPCFAINNAIYQSCGNALNPNQTIPIVLSFPSFNCFDSYAPFSTISNPFLLNVNNQNCSMTGDISTNNQICSFGISQQMKDELIKKMMSISPDLEKKEIKEDVIQNCIASDERKKNDNNSVNDWPLNLGNDWSLDSNKKKNRAHFTKDEDEKIKELVKKFGSKNWSIVAAFMNGRTAKQCRDRYSNYLIPGIFQGEWSKEEDNLLIKLYNQYGSKWSIIQNHFPQRSSNSIKNRWYYFLRKTNCTENNDQTDVVNKEKVSKPKEEESDINEKSEIIEAQLMTLDDNSINGEKISQNNQEIDNPFSFDIGLFPNFEDEEWNGIN